MGSQTVVVDGCGQQCGLDREHLYQEDHDRGGEYGGQVVGVY